MRLLAILGYAPNITKCVECGTSEDLNFLVLKVMDLNVQTVLNKILVV